MCIRDSVSPVYIMEPREDYEIYGDRPYVIFPCGAILVDDSVLVSYGAADSFIGFAWVKLGELMAIMDQGRIA